MHRYATVSGENPFDDMPEHFLQAFILDHLGNEITMTIETGLSKLARWNDDGRKRLGMPPLGASEEAALKSAAKNLGLRRLDMVVFDQVHPNQVKSDQGILAVVEFKKGAWALELDRKKLLLILALIDTCKYGVVAGACRQSEIAEYETMAVSAGDIWFKSDVSLSDFDKERYIFCARLFDRTALPAPQS